LWPDRVVGSVHGLGWSSSSGGTRRACWSASTPTLPADSGRSRWRGLVFRPDELPPSTARRRPGCVTPGWISVLEATGNTGGLTYGRQPRAPVRQLCVVGYHHTGDAFWTWTSGTRASRSSTASARPHALITAMRTALDLIATRRFSYAPLITHRFGLHKVDEAFRAIEAGAPEFVKGVLVAQS